MIKSLEEERKESSFEIHSELEEVGIEKKFLDSLWFYILYFLWSLLSGVDFSCPGRVLIVQQALSLWDENHFTGVEKEISVYLPCDAFMLMT